MNRDTLYSGAVVDLWADLLRHTFVVDVLHPPARVSVRGRTHRRPRN